jgi:hypothetical protein
MRLVGHLAACGPCIDPILNVFKSVSHERSELYEPWTLTQESPAPQACEAHVKLSREFLLRQE